MIGHKLAAVTVGTDIPTDVRGAPAIALRFGTGGGNAVLKNHDDTTVTLYNIQDAEQLSASVKQVVSVTGDVANIIAVYE